MVREVIFFKNYFYDFFNQQTTKVQKKIDYVIDMVAYADRIPEQYFKHLQGTKGLYEIRIQLGSNAFRIFCCFDEDKLVVLFNGFTKKTDKTPKQELERAERIKEEYFSEKLKKKKK